MVKLIIFLELSNSDLFRARETPFGQHLDLTQTRSRFFPQAGRVAKLSEVN